MGFGEFMRDIGLNFRMPSISGDAVMTFIIYTIYIGIALAFFSFIIFFIQQKKKYKYRVRIFRRRENNQIKEINCKGGYISQGDSKIRFFRIKFNWFKYIDLMTTPNLAWIDNDDRIYYYQIDVDTFIQVRREFDKNAVRYIPVESDIKYGAVLSVQKIRDVLKTESTFKRLLPFLALLILAIVFIVSYYLLLDKCRA